MYNIFYRDIKLKLKQKLSMCPYIKMKFSFKDFFSQCDQIRSFL